MTGPALSDVVGHARVGHRGDRDVPQSVECEPRGDGRHPPDGDRLGSDPLGGRPQDPLYEPATENAALGTDEHQGLGVGVGTPPVSDQVPGQLVDEECRHGQGPKALLGLSFGLEGQVPRELLHASSHCDHAPWEINVAHPQPDSLAPAQPENRPSQD